ncbi:MAG TPA: Hint domain-containing protein [Candidatus Dependentiae bacterium]|nr:Hint domain-containing protein [Candidatus Dependentiae bacterium]HRQ62595.1 Hint domain-containing protein [Candidatus Dependentiae bacterium]
MKYYILAGFCLVFISQLCSHGFDPSTLVKNDHNSWYPLEQICELAAKNKKQSIASYDVDKKCWVSSHVASGGKSETNCYFALGLDGGCNDIICTPTQEFYLALTNKWVSAYELRQGDILLGQYNTLIPVTYVEFIKNKRAVCSIEVQNTHTFLVGQHAVLTHNMVLPVALLAGAKIPFELGALGSLFGLSIGAPAVVGGLVIGSVAGIIWKKIAGRKVVDYKLSFNTAYIEQHQKENNNAQSNYNNNSKMAAGGSPEDPENKDKNNKTNFFDKFKSKKGKRGRTQRFGNIYQDPDTKYWWSKDRASHGGSQYKVFKETSKGLEWIFDADAQGSPIMGKHKGPTGIFIPYKDIIGCS